MWMMCSTEGASTPIPRAEVANNNLIWESVFLISVVHGTELTAYQLDLLFLQQISYLPELFQTHSHIISISNLL